MIYINALNLINLAIENEILEELEAKVPVYMAAGTNNKEGWYLIDKDNLSKELMNDKKGQESLILALNDKGVIYSEKSYLWQSD